MALKSFVPGGLVFNFLSVQGSSSECQPSSRLQKGSGQSDGCRGHFCRKENLLRFVFELVLEKIKILMHLLFKHSLDLNSVCLGLRLGELIAVFLDLTQVPVRYAPLAVFSFSLSLTSQDRGTFLKFMILREIVTSRSLLLSNFPRSAPPIVAR